MAVRFSGAAWGYAHLVPVKRKLFPTLQTDYISAGLLCSSRPGLTCSGRKRETEAPVPAAEENIGPCEICVHDFVPNPSLLETKGDNCELDHARCPQVAIVGRRLERSSLCESSVPRGAGSGGNRERYGVCNILLPTVTTQKGSEKKAKLNGD
jgi:hypothetical protein